MQSEVTGAWHAVHAAKAEGFPTGPGTVRAWVGEFGTEIGENGCREGEFGTETGENGCREGRSEIGA